MYFSYFLDLLRAIFTILFPGDTVHQNISASSVEPSRRFAEDDVSGVTDEAFRRDLPGRPEVCRGESLLQARRHPAMDGVKEVMVSAIVDADL